MLILSYILQHFIWPRDLGPLNALKNILLFIGVVIHELCHFIMALLVGAKPKGIEIHFRGHFGGVAPHGRVRVEDHNYTFLQSVLIGLAPLIISTWLFFYLLGFIFSDQIRQMHVFLLFLVIFLLGSVFFGAAPSKADFRIMVQVFKEDPRYSLYQVFLVLISGVIIWLIIFYFEIELITDIFYYLLIGVGYYGLKYSIHGLDYIRYYIHRLDPSIKNLNYRRFKRSRFKPTPPRKLGKREPSW